MSGKAPFAPGDGVETVPPNGPQGPARSLSLDLISTAMGVFGLGFILVALLLASLNERQTLFREARDHAQNTAFFLADHAQRLFEVSDVALRSTTSTIGMMDWATIEQSKAAWDSLRAIDNLLPYVDDLWLNDEEGRLRLTTFTFPTPVSSFGDRPVFTRIRSAGDELVIGDRIVGKVTQKPTFLVARRLSNPDGSFRGAASVTLELSYFTDYWQRIELPNEERIAVVRPEDGSVLASFRSGTMNDLDLKGIDMLRAAIESEPQAGTFEPDRKTYGSYHRVGTLPLFVTVEFARGRVMAAWRDWMLRLAPLAAAAFIGLLAIMLLGRRQGQREAEATRMIAAGREALAAANQTLERRVAERTADLEESNREIQRFAYIVSHDLRAPLVNITGFTAEIEGLRPSLVAAEAPSDEVKRDFDEAIAFIRSSSAKMDRLIKAVLTLSRDGRRVFRPETIDMTALMKSIADGVAHRLQEADAVARVETLPSLTSDRIAVEQIFSNLIDNAAKYLRPGSPGVIVVSGERRGASVIVKVEDNGRGIDMKDHERVFDLFRRAGVQDQPGEGIGLAHVRALARRLGGTVRLESTLGAGSVFTVELPDLPFLTIDAPP